MDSEYLTKCLRCGAEQVDIDIFGELCIICEKQHGEIIRCSVCDSEDDINNFTDGYCTTCYSLY